jgi:hypothetical protein
MSVAGSFDDTNALANITIAGWSQESGRDGCSAVKIMTGGKMVDSSNVKITSGNGAVYVTGLEGLAKAFRANWSITFV